MSPAISTHCLDAAFDLKPKVRDHVTFATTLGSTAEIVGALMAALQQEEKLTGKIKGTKLIFSWGYGEHALLVGDQASNDGFWVAQVVPAARSGFHGVTRMAHRLLCAASCLSDLRWRTATDYAARGDDWLPTPY